MLAKGPPLRVGHIPCAEHPNDAARLLLVDQKQHPPTIRDSEHQHGVAHLSTCVGVGEALFGLERTDTVTVEKLVLIRLVPLELRQVPMVGGSPASHQMAKFT